ncbi:glycosyltransferase family 2 protein [Patescibacteria group bacterium]|nr:glycosyltransferase family 2 protein [Patescibacteria group bacterium]
MIENVNAVTCIIPAYNESRTIANVIETCLKTPEINEIIVINDGSKDNTLAKLKPFNKKIKIINLDRNHGKGYAVVQGIKAACNSHVMFLDADLINLEPHHLYSLFQPIIENRADMTIGAFVASKSLSHYTLWRFSGQRCFQKECLIPLIKKIEKTNYGLEVFLNEKFKKKRVIVVPLIFYRKYHLIKPRKQKDWLMSYTREVWQVFQQTISVKSYTYSEKVKSEFLHSLACYLKISYKRVKDFLLEER